MHRLYAVAALVSLAACGGGGSGATPDPTTTAISVTVSSPMRMGQTTQASGNATLSNGTSQALSAGWQSDAPGVATVTGAGIVTGVANGQATIFIVSGGRQGQQLIRVVPDYQGTWSGGLRVTSCSPSGAWATERICDDFRVGSVFEYAVSFEQSGESMTARVSYGSPLNFPVVSAPIRADGTSSFTATQTVTESGFTFTVTVTFEINSARVGDLTGTVTEVWRAPNISGEMRVVQDIVDTDRTSVNSLDEQPAVTTKAGSLRRLPQ